MREVLLEIVHKSTTALKSLRGEVGITDYLATIEPVNGWQILGLGLLKQLTKVLVDAFIPMGSLLKPSMFKATFGFSVCAFNSILVK